MSFQFRSSQDSLEDLTSSSSSGLSSDSELSQEMLSQSQSLSQSFLYQGQPQPQPQVQSFASRIRNLLLQSNNQSGYGGGDPGIPRQLQR